MHSIQNKLLSLLRDQGSVPLKYREIGRRIGEKYPQTVKHHIESLLSSNLIVQANGFLKLSKTENINGNFLNLPFFGLASCGPATALVEDMAEGYIRISKNFLPGNNISDFYLIRATGNSMNRAKIGKGSVPIEDGDFVVVDNSYRAPLNGDYVLSIIDEAANIKKYTKDEQHAQVKLLSESTDDYFPIILHESDDFYVMGKVVEVIKS